MAEIEPAQHFDRMNKSELKSYLRATVLIQIASITGFSRKEVVEFIERMEERCS
jgi:hypothetical protein